jgi:hypothetical protein
MYYGKQLGTLALLQIMAHQSQAVNMDAIPVDPDCDNEYPYDAPDTVINFNAPVIINIYNEGCGQDCTEEPVECDGTKPEGDEIDYVLSNIEKGTCSDHFEVR